MSEHQNTGGWGDDDAPIDILAEQDALLEEPSSGQDLQSHSHSQSQTQDDRDFSLKKKGGKNKHKKN